MWQYIVVLLRPMLEKVILDAAAVSLGHEAFAAARRDALDDLICEDGRLAATLDEPLQHRVRQRHVKHDVRHVLKHSHKSLRQDTVKVKYRCNQKVTPTSIS